MYGQYLHIQRKKSLYACHWLIEDFRWVCLESSEAGVFPELGDLRMHSENRNVEKHNFGQWKAKKSTLHFVRVEQQELFLNSGYCQGRKEAFAYQQCQ